MKLMIFCGASLLVFLSAGAPADVLPAVTTPKSILKRIDDPVAKITFATADGNVFALYEEHGPQFSGDLDLQQIENTCAPTAPLAHCQLHVQLMNLFFSARWIKHSDATKIGQVVSEVKPKTEFEEASSTALISQNPVFMTGWALSQTHDFPVPFAPDEIRCDRWDWLAGLSSVPGSATDLLVESVNSENMARTNDTGMTENQSTGSAFNVQLHPTSNGNYQILTPGPMLPSLDKTFGNPPYASSQTLVLNSLDKQTHQPCLVSFGSSAASILSLNRQPPQSIPDPSTRQINQSIWLGATGFDIIIPLFDSMQPFTPAGVTFQ